MMVETTSSNKDIAMFDFAAAAGFKSYTAGLPPNLVPTPLPDIPAVPEIADPTDALYPFNQPQNVESILQNITIDRPLPLFIPPELKHKRMEYRIINDRPEEFAAAMMRHWQPVDKAELLKLFEGRVSGSDKTGRLMKPILMARDARIGEAEMKLKRQKLAEQNAGLDPKNRTFNSKYVDPRLTINSGDTTGRFSGVGMGRIKV
jgi:hypothetical protein